MSTAFLFPSILTRFALRAKNINTSESPNLLYATWIALNLEILTRSLFARDCSRFKTEILIKNISIRYRKLFEKSSTKSSFFNLFPNFHTSKSIIVVNNSYHLLEHTITD